MRYYEYILSSKSNKFASSKTNLYCGLTYTKALSCIGKGKCQCLVRQITDIWTRAGFGNYIISAFSISERLIKLNKDYRDIKKRDILEKSKVPNIN